MKMDSESGDMSCEEISEFYVKNTKFSVFGDDTENKSNESKYTCTIDGCFSSFNRPWRLENHITVQHKGERRYKCMTPGCDKVYSLKAHLKRHEQTKHSEVKRTKIACTEPGCTDQFSTKQNLQKHIQRFHTKHFKCKFCDETFSNHGLLKKHSNSHIQTNGTKCPHCDEMFYSLKKLQRHQNRHKTFPCSEDSCNELFMDYNLLRKHEAEKHKPEFSCTVCDLKFKDLSRLNVHKKSHLTEKQFYCDFLDCNKEFKYKRNLKQHQAIQHLGERFVCEKCDRCFTSKQRLKFHCQKPSCDTVKPRGPPPRGDARRTRKDVGMPKKALALDLSGFEADHQTHKKLLQGDRMEISMSSDDNKEILEEECHKVRVETSDKEENDLTDIEDL